MDVSFKKDRLWNNGGRECVLCTVVSRITDSTCWHLYGVDIGAFIILTNEGEIWHVFNYDQWNIINE